LSKRAVVTAIVLLLLAPRIVAAAAGRLCFTRGDFIFIQEPNGRIRRLVKGYQPDISPDGQTIAFISEKGEWPDSDRHLNLLDIQSGNARAISTLNSFRSSHPLWSPDGRQLAIQLVIDHKPAFATVNPRTGDYYLIPSIFKSDYIFLNSWAPGGSSVILQDQEYVYDLALDGHIIRKFSIRDLFGDLIMSSLSRFSFSPDGRFLLFDSAMVPDDVGIASIYRWDIGAQRLSRLTSDRIGALDPKWLPRGNEIIFTGYAKGDYRPRSSIPYYHIYKVSVNGENPTILVRNAENASFSPR
jgi:Tol biopolymer transport system component